MLTLTKPLLLASSSASRKMLLNRLQLPFECISPNIDETPYINETAPDLAQRLALEKAQVVNQQLTNQHYIIASDQVAICDNRLLNKPLTEDKALDQLQFQSGKTTVFYTSLCLFDSEQQSYQLGVSSYKATFRVLSTDEIRRYITIDQPLHCAGSFKAESLGISLFTKLEGDDPNALIGLPLILLCDFLRNTEALV